MSYQYDAVFYRNGNYSSKEDAKVHMALHHWETTYGYSATMDAFNNSIDLLNCYDSSAIEEFRFIWTIDDIEYPEMDHRESRDLLDKSYAYFGNKDKYEN